MMNDGMTVGELRQLLNTQELLDLLEKLHIDTGTFGQILTIINKMPSVADSVRVSFGTPNHAGLYTVTAVTDSKNYETGVGIGTLLVKMRSKGVKLNWNERFVNGKILMQDLKVLSYLQQHQCMQCSLFQTGVSAQSLLYSHFTMVLLVH